MPSFSKGWLEYSLYLLFIYNQKLNCIMSIILLPVQLGCCRRRFSFSLSSKSPDGVLFDESTRAYRFSSNLIILVRNSSFLIKSRHSVCVRREERWLASPILPGQGKGTGMGTAFELSCYHTNKHCIHIPLSFLTPLSTGVVRISRLFFFFLTKSLSRNEP